MPATIQSLGIDQLPAADRLRLMDEIWDSLSLDEIGVPEWQWEIIDERIAEADANPTGGSSLEDVMARLRALK